MLGDNNHWEINIESYNKLPSKVVLFKLLEIHFLIPQGLLKYLLNFDCTVLGDGNREMNKMAQFLEFLHLKF